VNIQEYSCNVQGTFREYPGNIEETLEIKPHQLPKGVKLRI
jgi:hypothetical protein